MIAVICPRSLSGHQDQQGASSGKCSTAILDTIQRSTDRKNMETDPTELQLLRVKNVKAIVSLLLLVLMYCVGAQSGHKALQNRCFLMPWISGSRTIPSATFGLGQPWAPFHSFCCTAWSEFCHLALRSHCDTCLKSGDFRLLFLTFNIFHYIY